MLARVSNIEAFRRWRLDEDQTVEGLLKSIIDSEPTPAMLAGTAFHSALEHAEIGSHDVLEAHGYTFHMQGSAEIEMAPIRELRANKQYGDLTVTGQVDCLIGRTVIDHKTTRMFDAERYLSGYQWRFYLDIFEADIFRWNVFEISKRDDSQYVYDVAPPQILHAARYPDMRDDCARLARDYLEFFQSLNK